MQHIIIPNARRLYDQAAKRFEAPGDARELLWESTERAEYKDLPALHRQDSDKSEAPQAKE